MGDFTLILAFSPQGRRDWKVNMEKLVCDKCGFELTEPEDINLAIDGMEAWQEAQRNRGCEPRGLFPCKYFAQCQGEMQLVRGSKKKASRKK
jgi:hypothetical protein